MTEKIALNQEMLVDVLLKAHKKGQQISTIEAKDIIQDLITTLEPLVKHLNNETRT